MPLATALVTPDLVPDVLSLIVSPDLHLAILVNGTPKANNHRLVDSFAGGKVEYPTGKIHRIVEW